MSTTQCDIIVLLDSSGSMGSMGSEPMEAMNSFVNDQKLSNQDGTFSLWTFDTDVTMVIDDKPLKDIQPYTEFIPKGMTAIHDAIGKAITTKLTKKNKNNVICLIVTDGNENSSREYSGADIKRLISKMEDIYKWKFIYIGANQDVVVAGNALGIRNGFCSPFNQKAGDLLRVTRQASAGVSAYRSGSEPLHLNVSRAKSCPNHHPLDSLPPPVTRQSHRVPQLVRQSTSV